LIKDGGHRTYTHSAQSEPYSSIGVLPQGLDPTGSYRRSQMSEMTTSVDTTSIDLLIEDIDEDMFADPQHAIPCPKPRLIPQAAVADGARRIRPRRLTPALNARDQLCGEIHGKDGARRTGITLRCDL
jgi:hypothetical protein